MSRRLRLSQDQIDRIAVLREEKGLSYSAISREVGCTRSAANFICRRDGVYHPSLPPGNAPRVDYIRNGRAVRRYSSDEDLQIEAMRADGRTYGEIGRALSRHPTSVRLRLMTLAWREGLAERDLAAAQ